MFNTEGFKTLKGLTDALMQRQELLSNNLANIETKITSGRTSTLAEF